MLSCAVIGCGASGMAACKALRQSGLLVTCFEISTDSGGIWSSDTRSSFSLRGLVSPVFPTMRCVLPKDLMSFSDMRFDYTVPQFPHHSSVCRYLDQYAERMGIRGLVRFSTKVQSVRYVEHENMWRVITVNIVNGDVFEWSFDRVCVCTGQTQEPRYPDGIKELLKPYIDGGGELHHASHIKDFRQFKGKRVVVVGDGVTARDYTRELLRSGSDVYHSSCPSFYRKHKEEMEKDAKSSAASKTHHGLGGSMLGEALQLFSRIRGLGANDMRANHIVSNCLKVRNDALWGKVPCIGHPLSAEGRGVLFTEPPRQTADIVVEAKLRSLAHERRNKQTSTESDPPNGVFIDNIDAVICATGYQIRYPFLHNDLRNVVEGSPPLQIPQDQGEQLQSSRGVNPAKPLLHHHYHHGLYLGTLYAHCPSIAFVGMQKELLPPFMLFEAQAKFIAYSFTNRLNLPASAEGLLSRQSELLERYPQLENLYNPHGVGLYSAVYFNLLQEELQVGSRNTYTASIMSRQQWAITTSLLRFAHKLRSMAPLKRKRQHVLFSNAI